jgi:3,4-dihydroxy 2-butanone 4-phosphate synthase/GTP cyclohydrolase II
MSPQNERVKRALSDLAEGKMVILMDDENRENEGDLIVAAEKITPEIMNFMIRYGSGIVCLSTTSERLKKLNLPLMVPEKENTSMRGTPFTLSIDAREGITTGVSATDRTRTVQIAMQDDVDPDKLAKPGHIFPLQARDGGVLERQGHTEGAVDLARLAGFKPAAVLCEIMNPDGTMAHDQQIEAFAKEHELNVLSIDDIITYRLQHENFILDEVETILPIEHYGSFKATAIKDEMTQDTHIVLQKEMKDPSQPYLVRIHSSCVTGDLFASKRCDCNKQLHYALQRINEEGGMLIYLNQEGRGIGLFDKIRAYALQDRGFDTVEANQQLGLPADSRNYYLAANILRNRHFTHIRLLTNNLNKVSDMQKYGIETVERVPMPSFHNEHNHHYLKTKNEKLNHVINFDFTLDLKRSNS